MTTIHNPVLTGFNPDPCLCAAHGKYYLATSTFQWMPGVSLYESDDLVTWHCLGGALDGLDLRGIPNSGGVWAPDLTFDGKRFWLVFTVSKQIDGIFKDVENYVICAERIEGPWSEPVFVNASGFDPGMYHEDGRHYVLNPQWDPRPLPGHHRFNGLILQEFSPEQGLVGEARVVLDNVGAVNWLREGPHIMCHDGWYYIACAEGGTGRRHRIRMARSRELWGPYEVCPEPLVCAWCADAPLRKAGHGNFVEASDGRWYVCHLTSRYLPNRDGSPHVFDEREDGVSPLGRETALERVCWVDGWPRLAAGEPGGAERPRLAVDGSFDITPQLVVEAPSDAVPGRSLRPGEVGWRYETSFDPARDLWREGWLWPRYTPETLVGDGRALMLAEPSRLPIVLSAPGEGVNLGGEGSAFVEGGLIMRGGDSPSSLFDRCALERRVVSHAYHAETTFMFEPRHYNQTAGLICEYDARAFYYLAVGYDEERARRVIDVLACDNGDFTMPLGDEARIEVPEGVGAIRLAVDVDGYDLTFSYGFAGEPLTTVVGPDGAPLVLDASTMSDEHVAGWTYTGSMVGVTCVDMFDKTTAAAFLDFAYEDVEPSRADVGRIVSGVGLTTGDATAGEGEAC